VDASQAQASFENGVLEVTLPLPEEANQQKQRIEIREKSEQAAKSSVH
jgi:HSP20 family molecular chaperone IbpA